MGRTPEWEWQLMALIPLSDIKEKQASESFLKSLDYMGFKPGKSFLAIKLIMYLLEAVQMAG